MNRQIRIVALVLGIAFLLLAGNLVSIQLVRAENLASHPANTRLLQKEYALERGAILSSDGQTLALSEERPDSTLKFLRVYPTGELFAHVTGYYSVRFGRTGLESRYNDQLLGRGGVITMQEIGDRLLGFGQRGDSLFLTIDSRVQTAAMDAMGSRTGAVVALDPLTGEILALYSSPSFDPNPLSQHSPAGQEEARAALLNNANKPDLNRAIAEIYPPGSTFKVVTAAAGLTHGETKDTTFPSTASYLPEQTDKPITNFGGASCGGDMTNALRVSCNTYFARLAAELPEGALFDTASAFGFGEIPPIDLGAVASKLPTPEDLSSPAFTAQSGIGQFEVAATPLQMALVAAGIANRGDVVVPRLVKEVRDHTGRQVSQTRADIWKRAVDATTAGVIKDMMVVAVEQGFARTGDVAGTETAGKTGTAETGRPDDSVHVWYIAFAPADSPRIAIAVLIEAGDQKDATGAGIAAPIGKEIMEAHKAVAGW
jgi:peptidoglycan glycosyltransferase